MPGWIKLHRNLEKWEWYSDGPTVRVFLHLLLTANHEPAKWRGIDVGKGQVITGRKKLAEKLGLSERQVRTALNHLISTKEVTTKATNRYTLITIVNWGKYQKKDDDGDQLNDQGVDQLPTNERPTNDQQPTTNKNEKNNKNDKKVEDAPPRETPAPPEPHPLIDQNQVRILAHWKEAMGHELISGIDKIMMWVDEEGERLVPVIEYAISEAALKGKPFSYVLGTIKGLVNDGITNAEALEKEKARKQSNQPKPEAKSAWERIVKASSKRPDTYRAFMDSLSETDRQALSKAGLDLFKIAETTDYDLKGLWEAFKANYGVAA